jgi:hypothetical protein
MVQRIVFGFFLCIGLEPDLTVSASCPLPPHAALVLLAVQIARADLVELGLGWRLATGLMPESYVARASTPQSDAKSEMHK